MKGITDRIEERVKIASIKAGVDVDHPLLVAVSGGADSMALLQSVVRCGLSCEAAHCNFHLRGEESDRDALFVKRRCEALGVKLNYIDFATEEYMKERRMSLEMACRELRYDWFGRLLSSGGFARLVTAHHRDDNIETLLLNLMRGAGAEGLKGMEDDTGVILRPLLSFSRRELEEYLHEVGEEHVTDSTNFDSEEADRNFLRLEVIPMLKRRWKGVEKSLEKSRVIAKGEAKIVEAYCNAIIKDDFTTLSRGQLLSSVDAITLVHYFLKKRGAVASQEEEIVRSMLGGAGSGQMWKFSTSTAWYVGERLKIVEEISGEYPKLSWGYLEGAELKKCLEELKENGSKEYVLLSGDRGDYVYRKWERGEKMQPFGFRGKKLISDMLREGGVAKPLREGYHLLAERKSGKAVWLPGVRRGVGGEVTDSDLGAWEVRML